MKDQQQISSGQMCSLFFIFITGSAITNMPGPLINYAQNGAWLSILFTLVASLLLMSCVLFLYQKFPHLTLIEYSRQLMGNWFTAILAMLFLFILLHSTSGIVLDIGLFLTSSMMRDTPLYVFHFWIFLVVVLAARLGIETLVRMFTVLGLSVLVFITSVVILASHNYQIEHLVPVFPDGIKPILLGSYFLYGTPYIELVLFSMLLPYVRQREKQQMKKGMYLALIVNAFFMILVTFSTILTFGPIAGDRAYSLFEVARTIDLYIIIKGVELLIGYSLIIMGFMKAVITFYILNILLTHLFKLNDNRILTFPLGLVCFLFSMLQISQGQARWVNAVTVIEPLWKILLYFIPFLILTVAAAVKKT